MYMANNDSFYISLRMKDSKYNSKGNHVTQKYEMLQYLLQISNGRLRDCLSPIEKITMNIYQFSLYFFSKFNYQKTNNT